MTASFIFSPRRVLRACFSSPDIRLTEIPFPVVRTSSPPSFPTEVDIEVFNVLGNISTMEDHHLSLTSPGPSGVHHLERPLNITFEFSSQPMLAGQQENMNFTAPETHATGKDPMVRWYEVNDGPWHPPELTAGTGAGGGQPMVSGMRDNQFIVPNRSNMVPSEIMPQSDSGYGSYHNQPSIANGSVCDDSFDTNPDTQSIMGGSIVDAQFSMPDAVSENHIALGVPCDSWASPPIRLETMSMTCRECGKPVKTKSEMRLVLPTSIIVFRVRLD